MNFMYKLNVNLEFGFKDAKGEPEKPQSVAMAIILQGVTSKYPNGMDGAYRRTFGRLQIKFEEAAKSNIYKIALESDEYDLIKNVLADGKFPPVWSKQVLMLEEEFAKCEKLKL